MDPRGSGVLGLRYSAGLRLGFWGFTAWGLGLLARGQGLGLRMLWGSGLRAWDCLGLRA